MEKEIKPVDSQKEIISNKNPNKVPSVKKETNCIVAFIRKHFAGVTIFLRFGVAFVSFFKAILGDTFIAKTTEFLRKIKLTFVPYISKNFPRRNGYTRKSDTYVEGKSVIYFSACLNRVFAPSRHMHDLRPIEAVFKSLCDKAGIAVVYPKAIDAMCCGKPFEDYSKDAKEMKDFVYAQLLEASKNGTIPIVMDHSTCTGESLDAYPDAPFKIYDLHEYILQEIAPNITFTKKTEDIGLFIMCIAKKHGFGPQLEELAGMCTTGEIVLAKQYCCAFLGDKGFFTPEKNIRATTKITAIYDEKKVAKGYSSSSTCEIGFADRTGFSWQHIAYLVDEVTSKKA